MDVCKDLISTHGAPVCVVAEFQEKGRGRGKNLWHNVDEGFYGTFGFERRKESYDGFSVFLGYEILKSLNLTPDQALLKWPNDLILSKSGKKFCGILIEIWNDFILVGVGLNLKSEKTFGSLFDIGINLSREGALDILLNAVNEAFTKYSSHDFILPTQEIWQYDYFQGRWITTTDSIYRDQKLLPVGLSESGALLCLNHLGVLVEVISSSELRVCD